MVKIKLLFIVVFSTICNAQIVNIPDANFKAALLSASSTNHIAAINMPSTYGVLGSMIISGYNKIDVNNDGEIQVSEAQNILSLEINNKNISNLAGIEAFINLVNLECDNNVITSLNLTQNINLKYLDCSNNLLTSLDISQNTNLLRNFCRDNQLSNLNLSQNLLLNMLICRNNPLSSLDVTQNLNLLHLDCSSNQLINLNLNNNTLLKSLGFYNNQISTIDLSNLTLLESLACSSNQLTNLDISSNTLLRTLDCGNNLLTDLNTLNNTNLRSIRCNSNLYTHLDFSHLPLLVSLSFQNNINLISANLKNNNEYWDNFGLSLYFDNNPNLEYICADEEDVSLIEDILSYNTNTNNCHVNSYCSFTPSGTFYTIQGNEKLDSNNNGCDSNDIIYPNLKCTITNGTNTGTLIANNSGSYNIPVQAGTHSITPIIENPTYFNIIPNTFTVSFPSSTSPYNQDFCISANGIHNDLEIVVLPVIAARPGFNAYYKITYKNKGTTTQSGTINFIFEDSVLDFVSSNTNFTSQSTGNLTWDFTNLVPFESREIDIVLNLNSPTEIPALNSGDVLSYSASINGLTDETPSNNSFILNQMVVNSYDPNDKSCLEGTTITPSMVGDYAHYLIRFENNGTANAQNIVVKDIIDTDKFDINTLLPIKGSHNFETRISNTNKVEFIFKNINLPFDDANNDGYVSFKIKTKLNLVVGNTFSNSANIYFDYNSPIVTNNYTTTIQNSLGSQENEFINDIATYPNPVKDILNFKTQHNIFKIEIYDISGRKLSSNSISENKIDLRELKTGNYILKLYTEKGIINTKIVKE
ncbi:T9SS type A sorting domain-containing protein [Flavobacterium silvisoli]|uniref:T9SS type A sorting domain-containing protein n=1 Tax=Flavobacterium silvisoli TaxID=2529433 RepID=A0A4Q9Z471_9FLAO|nr:T9SS type A sorting domain-containing protein [Flavobacterium silvisoli]TBX70980.1 T9SS type A sorting domain-containing protein [Flavobacterium silvisoli]